MLFIELICEFELKMGSHSSNIWGSIEISFFVMQIFDIFKYNELILKVKLRIEIEDLFIDEF